MVDSVEVWLWLLLVMHPHKPKTTALVDHYGSATEAARAMRDGRCTILSESEKQRVKRTRTREVRELMDECAANGIRIITLSDPEYPALLANIDNPPIVLFVMGSLSGLNDEVTVAGIGTRSASQYGIAATEKICTELVSAKTVLVSGLALGIDTAVHRCAVSGGVRTIGVLACGCLVNYPPENSELKKQIVEQGGALVSELLPHAEVSAGYFKERNRIISGLALGTIIFEAASVSGCMLTAQHCLRQGRELFCVPPHDIMSEHFSGVVEYLRDGAVPVFSHIDVINRLGLNYAKSLKTPRLRMKIQNDPFTFRSTAKRSRKQIKEDPSAREEQPEPLPELPAQPEPAAALPPEELYASLEPTEASVLRMIAEKPRTIDELIEANESSHAEMATVLMDLEIFGHIALQPDGTYSLP